MGGGGARNETTRQGCKNPTSFADEGSADGDSDELNAQSYAGLMKKV